MKPFVNKGVRQFVIIGFAILCVLNGFAQQTYVNFSVPSGVKTASFSVALSTTDPTRQIRYTTNGTMPTQQSTLYSQPITITQTTRIIACSWKNNVADSLPSQVGYIFLDADMSSFSSNLPLLIIENFGQGALPKAAAMSGGDVVVKQFSVTAFYVPGSDSRTKFTNAPVLVTNSGIKTRGSSSASFAKTSIGFDSWDQQSQETEIEPLGMPASSDWVISGSRDIDNTYIRSVFMYQLSNDLGRWAPHSKAVEVFVNKDGGNIKKADYQGIYYFMEKIGRGKDKVDIEKLSSDIGPKNPDISGGYILKVDRLDPEAVGFKTMMSDPNYAVTNYYYPKERNMPDSQKTWIVDYLKTFETALQNNPAGRAYTQYFDPASCIDQWILNVMSFNVDAFMFSFFLHKSRNGILQCGPLWDTDRSLGADDFRLNNPERWDSDMLADVWTFGWFNYLFKDPEFDQALRDRWYDIRQNAFDMDKMKGIIDSLTTVMAEAAPRDAQLWGFKRGYQGEMDYLKTWMERRVVWMDGQLGYTPVFLNGSTTLKGGKIKVAAGFKLKIDRPSGKSGDIYYCLDGIDPRVVGGGLNTQAIKYSSEITINRTTTVWARIRNGNAWSCYRKMTFVVEQDLSKIKITEINYNPQKQGAVDGDNYEFIELKNTGSETLYLAGVHFTDGVEFNFPDSAKIAPGEFIVIASNTTRFKELYSKNTPYQYTGKLDNGGETITLSDIFNAVITTVTYNDEAPWPTQADGQGYTLVPNEKTPVGNQNQASLWKVSAALKGSPFADDIYVIVKPIIVNEVIANAQYPQVNAIELYNPNNETVDVGGWIISNKPLLSKKWSIPAGTTIAANQYLVLKQGHYSGTTLQFGANEFGSVISLNRLGDEVYIYSSDGTNMTGYSHGISLEESLENISYGSYKTSTNRQLIVPLATNTLGTVNSQPLAGPIVLNQIYYSPLLMNGTASGNEFIQIKNISDTVVHLYDMSNPTNTFKINGTGFSFPLQTSIQPKDSIYLINSDFTIEEFRKRYNLNGSTQIFQFTKKLDNSGETISIQIPLDPYEQNGVTTIPYANLEKVEYSNLSPWPLADENGNMLIRINKNEFSDDVINWKAADGKGNLPPVFNVTVTGGTGSGSYFQGSKVTIFASDAPAGKSFYAWNSNNSTLPTDMFDPQPIFLMPGRDVVLEAIYAGLDTIAVIPAGSQWKYNNKGIDLGSSWHEEMFNDESWASGNAVLGLGTGVTTSIDIGAQNSRFPTIYFRKTFTVSDLSKIRSARFGINYDDGAVVYINGEEAQRLNLPTNAITYSTWASTSFNSGGMQYFEVDPRFFVQGENIVQVEVHNNSASSSDLIFDAQLSLVMVGKPDYQDSQSITLNQGWNLVSLYVIPNNNMVSAIFPNAIEVKNNEAFYSKNQSISFNSLIKVLPGMAYFVKNTGNETLTIKGKLIKTPFAIELKQGWNLMGVPTQNQQNVSILPAEALKAKSMDSFYIKNTSYNSLDGFIPGKGYQVQTNGNCTIDFNN